MDLQSELEDVLAGLAFSTTAAARLSRATGLLPGAAGRTTRDDLHPVNPPGR